MKTVDIRVHNSVEPICLRIVLPSGSTRAKTPPENFGPGARPLLQAALTLHVEVREAAPVGRPVRSTPEDLVSLLPAAGYPFAAWRRVAMDGGLSDSSFKRLRRRALALGQVVESGGRYFAASRVQNDGTAA